MVGSLTLSGGASQGNRGWQHTVAGAKTEGGGCAMPAAPVGSCQQGGGRALQATAPATTTGGGDHWRANRDSGCDL
jgi:hypothetical protein